MHNILIVSGTRPEIVKLAPVYHALRDASWASVRWLHTGQHAEMATQIFDCFEVTPDISLKRIGSSLLEFSTDCRKQLDAVMQRQGWSLVIVQGDTESAFQGALAAFYHGVPLAHVEAGLRTYNLNRPFPEEGLRQMISRLAKFHFAPTRRSQAALQAEGISDASIFMTGNTVIDAQRWVCNRHNIRRSVQGRGHLLVTVHRRENWGEDVGEICRAVAAIARREPDLQVLFPVHLNPVIQQPVNTILAGIVNVRLTAPLDYTQMQQALVDACLLLTDSGGLQEEAPTFGVPVLVLREETERPEAVEAGCALLIGASGTAIFDETTRLLNDTQAYMQMSQALNPFGDGKSSERIVDTLALKLLGETAAIAELV